MPAGDSADAGQTNFSIYSGCVENVDARAEGEPCDQWGGLVQTYDVPNLEDLVFIDPCAVGLFCAPDPKVRNHFSCQKSCELEANVGCPSSTQYCVASSNATQLEEYCRDGDGCDPRDPTSCGEGRGCYLHLNDAGDAVLTVCLVSPDMPTKDGEPCQSYNECVPGSSCWGPTRVPPSRWQMTDLVCRRTCTAGATASQQDDAGADVDGGSSAPGAGMCPGTDRCIDFTGSGLDLGDFKGGSDVGQCE